MSNWPADGIVVFVLIITAMAFIVAHPLFNYRAKTTESPQADGYLHMQPLRSAKALCFGLFLIGFCAVYAALQSGSCFNMSAAENAQNRAMGFLVSGALMLGALYCCYSLLLRRFWFDREEVKTATPFGAQKSLRFSEVKKAQVKSNHLQLTGTDGTVITLPGERTGMAQFSAVLDSHLLRFDQREAIEPIPETELLVGKPVRLHFFTLDGDLLPQLARDIGGTIDSIRHNTMIVRTASGKMISCPIVLQGIGPDVTLPPQTMGIVANYFVARAADVPAG